MDRRLPGDEDGLAPDRDVAVAAAPGRDERRRLALTALVAFVPLVVLSVWARLEMPAPWESQLLVAAAAREGALGDALRALTALGSLGPWTLLVLVMAVVAVAARRTWAGLLLALTVASDGAAYVVKALVERGRPEGALVEVLFGADSFAFPSGHVVRTTALVAVAAWLLAPDRWRLPAAISVGLLGGAVMGYSRVAVGHHWPTDAVGGLLLGIFWFAATAWLAGDRAVVRSTAPPVEQQEKSA